MRLRTFAALVALTPACLAQAPLEYKSHEVNPDRSITFRYQDPEAKAVVLNFDPAPKPIPMTRDDAGMWSYTSAPLPPEIYSYRFDVDGRPQFDPKNLGGITPNLVYQGDEVEVPGDGPQPWDLQAVPHGTLHRHTYTTHAAVGLAGDQSEFLVWTPPGFDPRAKTKYPVLYLLHGWSNTVDTWTRTLQADRVLDNLLTAGKIRPMIVVMPFGYGDMRFVAGTQSEVWREPELVDRNTDLFSKALLTEVLPAVERLYPVSAKREDRALAGLSMGGLESLEIGLNHTDQFAYIAGFSAAVHLLKPEQQLPTLTAKSANLRLLWIACGTEDSLINANRKLITYLKGEGLAVTAIETPGAHVSYVWRDNLVNFAPLLFQGK